MAEKTIYLDYAAATPMDKAVLQAMEPYFSDKFYNPSANYLSAKDIKNEITDAKKAIAGYLGAKHTEIIHTSGGTESNNLAIAGVMGLFSKGKALVSAIEHESVLRPAERYSHKVIPVDKQGIININELQKMITDDVVLISVMLVNNEVGTIQPVREIGELVKQIRKSRRKKGKSLPLYLHTDACQAPSYLDINTARLGVDLMTLNSGKIYGPKGSGILFVKSGTELKPQLLGGGQQRNLRSGTENPASLVGFVKALEVASKNRTRESEKLRAIRTEFISGLMKINPEIIINGHSKKHSPHIAHATFPGYDNERLLFQLDDAGILAASGSACSASSDQPSHVLGAMGISDELARSSLRFSFGRHTTGAEIDDTLKVLLSILA